MSREVYDACRRYKHFYNKHKDVESWNNKYHDIDLSDALKLTNLQLMDSEDYLLKALFKEYNIGVTNVEVNHDYLAPMGRFGRNCRCAVPTGSTANVEIKDSRRFIKCITDYMLDVRRNYDYMDW